MKSIIKRDSTQYLACSQKAGEYLYGKEFFQKYGKVFKNKIDTKKFEYSPKKHDFLRKCLGMGDEIVFLIVGHLIPLKNHFFAFQVFRDFKREIPNSKIYVLGDGEKREELLDWTIKYGLEKDIIFCGNIQNVNEYMIAGDFLFMPSFYEGLPVTLIEAQSAGLTCFVSNDITQEVKLTDLIHFLPINQGTQPWIKEVKKCLNYSRKNLASTISGHQYDLSDLRTELEHLYEG